MLRKVFLALFAAGLAAVLWVGSPGAAQAQLNGPAINKFYYYPYYYFPHNYWPMMGPKWPEPPGACYVRPPAYMAYPPFREPHWRYEWYEPQNYYRGSHFWLDQF